MARIGRSIGLVCALTVAATALAQSRPPPQAHPQPSPTPAPAPDDTVPVVGDLTPTYVSPFGNQNPTKGEADALDALQVLFDAWLSAADDAMIAQVCASSKDYEKAIRALQKALENLEEGERAFVKDYSPTIYPPEKLKKLDDKNPEFAAVTKILEKQSKYKHRKVDCPKHESRTVGPTGQPSIKMGTGSLPSAAQNLTLPDQILLDINLARTAPHEFIKVLDDCRRNYHGNIMRSASYPNGLITKEGVAAVDDAIGWMGMQAPRMPLMSSSLLAQLAKSLVDEQGRTGMTGHISANGDGPGARLTKLGGGMYVAESLTYGPTAARDVTLRLFLDDGQSDRGHRYMMMSSEYAYAGIYCGPHPKFKQVCALEYSASFAAGAYVPRIAPSASAPPPPPPP